MLRVSTFSGHLARLYSIFVDTKCLSMTTVSARPWLSDRREDHVFAKDAGAFWGIATGPPRTQLGTPPRFCEIIDARILAALYVCPTNQTMGRHWRGGFCSGNRLWRRRQRGLLVS